MRCSEHLCKATVINCKSDDEWLKDIINNCFHNHHKLGQTNKANKHYVYSDKPAAIVGCGPSLDEKYEELKSFKGDLFSSSSALMGLMYHGIKPAFAVIIDPLEDILKGLQGLDLSGITFLIHPGVNSAVLDYIQSFNVEIVLFNLKLVGLSNYLTSFFENIINMYFNTVLKLQYTGSVSNVSVQMANFLGYSPIYLYGVDFGFPNNKLIADRYQAINGNIIREENIDIRLNDIKMIIPLRCQENFLKNSIIFEMSYNNVLTRKDYFFYKNTLMYIYWKDKPYLINKSNGIITEIQTSDSGYNQHKIEAVCNGYFKGFTEFERSDNERYR